jgi:hypothetical protein
VPVRRGRPSSSMSSPSSRCFGSSMAWDMAAGVGETSCARDQHRG